MGWLEHVLRMVPIRNALLLPSVALELVSFAVISASTQCACVLMLNAWAAGYKTGLMMRACVYV